MKAFTFINSYIYGPQVGIQASHSIVELMQSDINKVSTWAREDKTMVWLDGGDSDNMDYLYRLFDRGGYGPKLFREPGMDNLLTSFSIVIGGFTEKDADTIRSEGLKFSHEDELGHAVFVNSEGVRGLTSNVDHRVLEALAFGRLKQP